MLDEIRRTAEKLEGELWEIVERHYGLTRTAENETRIHGAFLAALYADAEDKSLEHALPHELKPVPGTYDKEHIGLATCFMSTAIAKETDNPQEAIEMIALAAKGIGMIDILCKIGAPSSRVVGIALGTMLAELRHQSTYMKRMELESAWRRHCPIEMSAQKAATELARIGECEADGKLSHKKAAEIISALRKKELVRKK